MKTRNNYSRGNLVARLSLLIFAVLAGVSSIMAESRFSVSDIIMKPGEEKVVAVNFENTDDISSLQVDFTLPEGLSLVTFKNNEERIERGVHISYVDLQQGTTNKYRITVFANYNDPIPGEGALVYLTLKAGDGFVRPGNIVFDNAHLSDPDANRIDPADFSVTVSPEVGTIGVGESAFSLKPGEKHSVEVSMNNMIDVYAVEGRIVLPEGLTLEKNSRGRIVMTYGERLPQDATLSINEETGKFILSAMSLEKFGNSGPLFSVSVVADEKLAETSNIVISEVKVSGPGDVVFGFDEEPTVSVTNIFFSDYQPALETVSGLQTKLDEAIAKVAEVAPDVKDSESVTGAESALQTQIDELKSAVESAYADGTLVSDKETILSVVPGIESGIAKLVDDAIAAQKDFLGVGSITAEDKVVEGIYTISGQKVDSVVKGVVNIIKYTDGSVKKVFVK